NGADLRGAKLWRMKMTGTDLSLADLTAADFHTALTDGERRALRQSLNDFPTDDRERRAKERLMRVLSANDPSDAVDFWSSDKQPALVSAPPDPTLTRQHVGQSLITEPTNIFNEELAAYLTGDLAASDPAVAAGIV